METGEVARRKQRVSPDEEGMDSARKLRKLFGLPYLPLILAPMVLLAPVWLEGKALFWGTPATQFLPWWQWAFERVLEGHLPLWNPLVGMGAPLIGNYQSALFYPPNWIYFGGYILGGLSGMAWLQAPLVAVHLIWAGLGMARLMRRLGVGELAQTVSGLAFSLSGYLVARAWFASINSAVAWLPWALVYGYDLATHQKTVGPWRRLSLVLGLQLLAGHAQTAWYTWVLLGLWVGYWRWERRRIQEGWRLVSLAVVKEWGRLAGAFGWAIGLAAVQLIPTTAYLLQSQRASAAEYEAAMTYSFWPWRLLGLLTPNLFGNPAHQDYWGYGNFWEDAIYIGLLPFLLVFGAIIRTMRGRRGGVKQQGCREISPRSLSIFLLGVMSVSVVLALGKHTPVFPWLYRHVPSFDMFQSPTRYSIWLVTALAILAGMGIDRWYAPQGRGLYWTRLGTAGALAVTLAAAAGGIALKTMLADFTVTFIPAFALAGLWGLGSGILALTAPGEADGGAKKEGLWTWAVILWVGLDLVVAGWNLNPGIDLDFYRSKPGNIEEIQAMVGDGRLFLMQEDEYKIKYKRYFRFEGFEPEMGWENLQASYLPNMNMLEGISMVNNYDPLIPRRYANWMEMVAGLQVRVRQDLLDLMGISALSLEAEAEPFGVEFLPIGESRRVRWVPCAVLVPDERDALERLARKQIDIRNLVVLESRTMDGSSWAAVEEEDIGNPTWCTQAAGEAVIIESGNPNEVMIRSKADQDGWVVLGDTLYPGWRAAVDGERAAILPANYMFRAVAVPAGEHIVRFVYRPLWFYSGLMVSVLSAIAWILVRGDREARKRSSEML